jgi:DNA polymerase III epsilon subunit-like protein
MMSNKICFLYTHTNGFHETNEQVSKKNMFEFSRLIQLKYSIGIYDNENFNDEIKEKYTLTPKSINFNEKAISIHGIDYKKAVKKGHENVHVMNKLKDDLKGVQIIIGHNLHFHIRTIQVELFRTCVNIDFNNYILIDLMDFNRNDNISLINLAKKFNIDTEKYSDIKLIKKLFLPVYKNYMLNENNK